MYEEFKQGLITRIQEDIAKSRIRLDAHTQGDNKEAIGFERGYLNALNTTLFDIIDLDRDVYNNINQESL